MNVLFVHPSYPGHFGVLGILLAERCGWEITFLSATPAPQQTLPCRFAQYHPDSTRHRLSPATHPASLDEHLDHARAAHRAAIELRDRHGLRPDAIVGHACAGSYYHLRTVFDCPVIGYFDYLAPPFWSDEFVLRTAYPPSEQIRIANADAQLVTYGQLEIADAIVTPTRYQMSTMPLAYRAKTRVIFDCAVLDLSAGAPRGSLEAQCTADIDPGTPVVTYASRGLEAVRGFDVFMRLAKRLCEARPDVRILVAGEAVSTYGYEMNGLQAASFKDHVLAGDDYDTGRIGFLGRIAANELAALLGRSNLHVYLTVPFVLSWSCLHAMAAGCVVLGSDTAPVREVIEHGKTGLLAGFDDVDGLTTQAPDVLADPPAYRPLGDAARNKVAQEFSLEHTFPAYVRFIQEVVSGH